MFDNLVAHALVVYIFTSLTIPFWVPIVERFTGRCGIYWVFSVLTYYAYLAWAIFTMLLLTLINRWPIAGAIWLGIFALRVVQFARLCARELDGIATSSKPYTDVEIVVPVSTPASSITDTCLPSLTAFSACRPQADALIREALRAGSKGGVTSSCSGNSACRPAGASLGSVVLVGNGPSIRERGLGSIIDGFDTVVRFNSFVTKGLEEHTGSKTTLWCHMMQWYHVSTVEVAQKAAWLPTCYAWNHVVLAPLIFVPEYLMPMLPPRGAITWSPATYWRAHRTLGLRLHQVPTTGFVMLMRLLESVHQVFIVGFDGFSSGKELHYYKEKNLQVRVNAAGALLHDWVKEQTAIRRLIDESRIVLL
jgi:hypothetical protein|eukprot:jgi/Chrpa1/22771/Chrysochromulina_OHIO_Genome00027045-RA